MEKDFIVSEKTNQQSGLHQDKLNYPLYVSIPAQLFSYIFHPLFIPVIATWYLAFIHERYFTGITPHDKLLIIIRVAINTVIFPGITVLLLKALKFIKSVFVKTQRERIFIYVIANFFYFWMYLVFRSQPEVPLILTGFIFGIFLASSVALFANIYYKISMHALGVGALSGLMILIIFSGMSYNVFLPAMIVFLISGVVCTSRLIVSDHNSFDIYSGILFGIICQCIGYAFVM